jgi:hypothetical protein
MEVSAQHLELANYSYLLQKKWLQQYKQIVLLSSYIYSYLKGKRRNVKKMEPEA